MEEPRTVPRLKYNLRNALGSYKKSPLRLLDGAMKLPESTGDGSTHEREMTVFNDTNEVLYMVFFVSIVGFAQTTFKLFESVG